MSRLKEVFLVCFQWLKLNSFLLKRLKIDHAKESIKTMLEKLCKKPGHFIFRPDPTITGNGDCSFLNLCQSHSSLNPSQSIHLIEFEENR